MGVCAAWHADGWGAVTGRAADGERPSAGPAKGASVHGPDCTCVRCAGFESGHALSLRHGAYAVVALGPRVDELAGQVRELVPGYQPADEFAVRLLCLTMVRLERAEAALEQAEPGDLARLRQDALGWANTMRRVLNDLGMTPTARARLGLDVARTGDALRSLAEEGRAIRLAEEGDGR